MNHIFLLSIEDAQITARERLGRELSELELQTVRKCIEWGLESWWDVLNISIDVATEMY